MTPLHVAAQHHDMRAIKLLLDAGANPNQVSLYGWTALHYAVVSGDTEATRSLLPISRSAPGHHGERAKSPLYFAAKRGHTEVVCMLLAAGVDVNGARRNIEKMTPLQAAVVGGHSAIVDGLLAAGADLIN